MPEGPLSPPVVSDPVDPPGTDVNLATDAYERWRYALEFPRGGLPTFPPGQTRFTTFEKQELKTALSYKDQLTKFRSCIEAQIIVAIVDLEKTADENAEPSSWMARRDPTLSLSTSMSTSIYHRLPMPTSGGGMP